MTLRDLASKRNFRDVVLRELRYAQEYERLTGRKYWTASIAERNDFEHNRRRWIYKWYENLDFEMDMDERNRERLSRAESGLHAYSVNKRRASTSLVGNPPVVRRRRGSESAGFLSEAVRYGNHFGPHWSGGRAQDSVMTDVPAVDDVDEAARIHDIDYASGEDRMQADFRFARAQIGNFFGRGVSARGRAYALMSAGVVGTQGLLRGVGLVRGDVPNPPGWLPAPPMLVLKKISKKHKKGLEFTTQQ